jgi:hypothetical protein
VAASTNQDEIYDMPLNRGEKWQQITKRVVHTYHPVIKKIGRMDFK